jgi:glycosyltransferase involved in cell wall biosynthesis
MANPRLSIIIPCYNCADTLEEAAASCFTQGFTAGEFEIVMVDDGSKDGTEAVMEKLAAQHPEIRLAFHEKNRGGGAARNTGIRTSKGSLVYCLDADNFFAPNALPALIKTIDTSKADGAIFAKQRFFHGTDSARYEETTSPAGRIMRLEDIFNGSGVVIDNFLMTRVSFEKAGGYPEHHDFDTQAFEARYLAAGNRLVVSADGIFYHRLAPKQPSYFERSYNSGKFSLNYYLILEELWDKLSDKARSTIISYDIFTKSSFKENIFEAAKALQMKGELFTSNAGDAFGSALALYKQARYNEALTLIGKELSGLSTPVILYLKARCEIGAQGADKNSIEKKAFEQFASRIVKPRQVYKSYHRHAFGQWLVRLVQMAKKALR